MQSPACTRDGITIQGQEVTHEALRVEGILNRENSLYGFHSMMASIVEIFSLQTDTLMKSWQIK